nr:uncharacterized protein LOC117860144 isoform X2 [Setaria viridis]
MISSMTHPQITRARMTTSSRFTWMRWRTTSSSMGEGGMHLPTGSPAGNFFGAMELWTPWARRGMDSTTPTTGLAGTFVPARINNRPGRNFHPCRDDPDDDHRRGTRRHCSNSAWSRVYCCRGMVEDCYSSTRYHGRGGNYGQSSYRSQCLSPPPSWGVVGYPQKETKKKWIAKSKKRVSFASPLAQVFGPSKEDYIREMLNALGWEPVASPMADDDLEEGEVRELTGEESRKGFTKQNISILDMPQMARHLPHLLTKTTMEALKMAIK